MGVGVVLAYVAFIWYAIEWVGYRLEKAIGYKWADRIFTMAATPYILVWMVFDEGKKKMFGRGL